jgi:ribose transport system substrate-binding protein
VGLLYVLKAAEFSVRAGGAINEAGSDLGWKIVSNDPAGDPQKAVTGMNSFVTQKVDAILSATWEASVVHQPLLAAKDAKTPVIDMWGGVQPNNLYTSELAPDETKFGTAGSEAFLKLLNSGDKVAMLTSSGFTFGSARDNAFTSLSKDKNINIVAKHDTDYTNAQADTTKAVDDMLVAHPDLNGIFSDSSLQLPEIATELKKKGLCGKIKVLGFYGDLPNLAAVRDGCVDIIADIPVMAQSWAIMDLLAQHFATGAALPTSLPTTYPFDPNRILIVTKANVPQNANQYDDLSFDYKKWLTDRWAQGIYGPPSS